MAAKQHFATITSRCVAVGVSVALPLTVARSAVARQINPTKQHPPSIRHTVEQQTDLQKQTYQQDLQHASLTAAATSSAACIICAMDPLTLLMLCTAAQHELSEPCTLLLQQRGFVSDKPPTSSTQLAALFADTLVMAEQRDKAVGQETPAMEGRFQAAVVMAAAAQHDLAGAYSALLP